jgi:hypothetical protein
VLTLLDKLVYAFILQPEECSAKLDISFFIQSMFIFFMFYFTEIDVFNDNISFYLPLLKKPDYDFGDLFEESFTNLCNFLAEDIMAYKSLIGRFLGDVPTILSHPWQMSFQFPSSPFMDKLDILHSFIMGFLVAIVTFVLVWLYFLLLRFTYKIRNLNVLPRIVQIQHNSLLEFV